MDIPVPDSQITPISRLFYSNSAYFKQYTSNIPYSTYLEQYSSSQPTPHTHVCHIYMHITCTQLAKYLSIPRPQVVKYTAVTFPKHSSFSYIASILQSSYIHCIDHLPISSIKHNTTIHQEQLIFTMDMPVSRTASISLSLAIEHLYLIYSMNTRLSTCQYPCIQTYLHLTYPTI